ncbi:MAG: nucleoside recognition domain-containing protein [Mycobacterium leprae]
MRIWHIVRTGLHQGVLSLLKLARFVLPAVFLLNLLGQSRLFGLLAGWFTPLTAPLGLPGVAALALLTGLLVNKFAGIAGLLLLPLSPAQAVVAGVFLALAHNVMVELLIVWQSRLPLVRFALLRVGTAYLAATVLHLLLRWTGWFSQTPLPPILASPVAQVGGHSVYWVAGLQALRSLWALAQYLLPLFVLMEVLRQTNLLRRLERFTQPFTRMLRLQPSLAPVLLAGLLLGVATGAGVMEQALRDRSPESEVPGELWRLNLFLQLFHSIIEDTVMFALFPVSIAVIAVVRLLVAWSASLLLPAPHAQRAGRPTASPPAA